MTTRATRWQGLGNISGGLGGSSREEEEERLRQGQRVPAVALEPRTRGLFLFGFQGPAGGLKARRGRHLSHRSC